MSLISEPCVGKKYHVCWGESNGVVGTCIEVFRSERKVALCSPRTKKVWKFKVKWSDLRYLRYGQALILSSQK